MSESAWLITLAAGVILVLLVLTQLTKRRQPPEVFGKLYIRQQLDGHGIAEKDISDECISELVSIAMSSAEIESAAGSKFKKSYQILLDSMIDVVLLWRSNPEDTMFQSIGGEMSMFREIMERNHVVTNQDNAKSASKHMA